MQSQEILALYDQEQRIDVEYPAVRKEHRPHLIRYIHEKEGPHFILYSRLAGADVEAVIAGEQAYFSPLGEVEWKVFGHDQPADLRQRLAARGFKIEEPEAIMALDLEDDLPETLLQSRAGQDALSEPAVVTVQRLESPAQLADVRRIEETVWSEDFGGLIERLSADLSRPGYLSVYTATLDDRPASAAWIYFHPNSQFAGLWGGSTLAEYRGRGLYTALLAARVREAADRGYRFLTIDASPMSRPIVARHGFRLLTMAWACTWEKAL